MTSGAGAPRPRAEAPGPPPAGRGREERLAVWFEGPRRIGVRREALPGPQAGEALVRTRLSAISSGTELAAYRGRLDPGLARDETLPALRGGAFRFPFPYGYASVGVVERLGEPAPPGAGPPPAGALAPGDRVFAFVPHRTAFTAAAADLERPPPGIPDERAALFPYLETAVNLLLDGRPLAGERVAVLGQGALGLALTALLARFPLDDLVTADPDPERRARSREFGASSSVPPEEAESASGARADLVFEVSGNPAALDGALRLAAPEGRIVVGSWLAGDPTPLDLGGAFHRGRLRLVSSQVSRLPPLGPAWSVARRRKTAWRLLAEVPLERLVTLRTPFAEAASAYESLDRGGALAALLLSPR